MVKEAANPSSSYATWPIKMELAWQSLVTTVKKNCGWWICCSRKLYKNVQYSGVNSSCISQLAILTAVSAHCEQFIKYECLGSVLLNNENPYRCWVSRDHEKMKYWVGAGPADLFKCACGVAKQCPNPSDGCNCDKNDVPWREDKGILPEKSHHPVIGLRFGSTGGRYLYGFHTLGKLKCYATTTLENNDLIGWIRKNNRAARATRSLVQFLDVVCQIKTRNIFIYFNGASTSPFAACFVNNKGCEEEAIITK